MGPRLALLLLALTFALDSSAALDTCRLGSEPVAFAGHAFPLDSPPDPTPLELVEAFPALGFASPVFVTAPTDGTNRLFVVERAGRIQVFPNDPAAASAAVEEFLDITDRVESGGEKGLLGLAFHPGYAQNGFFYVNYIAPGSLCTGPTRCTRISRLSVSAQDPDLADAQSEVVLLEFQQPYTNHNGGMLAFGPDGKLYVASGDGGSGGDPLGSGQDRTSVLGALLRLDVDAGPPWVPADNPWADGAQGFRGEIWHYGLRNPWRFSFDRLTGDLWIADVGQGSWEEVTFLPDGTPGGQNLGWNHCEGTHDYGGRDCAALGSWLPTIEYPHAGGGGYSITGGYVYRGALLPALFGAYVYADYVSGRIWAYADGASTEVASQTSISSFGEDRDGEVLVVNLSTGKLYRLQEAAEAGEIAFPATLSQTGLFEAPVSALLPAVGLVEYEVASPLWSDRALKRRWLGLPAGGTIRFQQHGNWEFPIGSVWVKHFDLPLGASRSKLETRVLLRQNDRFVAATYRWRQDGSDADLVTQRQTADVTLDVGNGPETQTWDFPGPGDCMGCHTSPEGRVLGVRTHQLNREVDCGAGESEDQLAAWESIGLFDGRIGPTQLLPSQPDPADPDAGVDERVRSYLASNCAMCHQPLGPAPGDLDLRLDTPLGAMRLVGVPALVDLGVSGAERVRLGSLAESVLWLRAATTDPGVRMARGTRVPDDVALTIFQVWIEDHLTADADGDGVPNGIDNCVHLANPAQLDADADGVGDACPGPCLDGIDNDDDGLVDHPADAGCRDAVSVTENPQCQDGVNNDPGQDPDPGLIDFDGGLSALGYVVSDPDPQCVGLPWKNNEKTACGLGSFELALILPGLMWLHRRRRRLH